MKPSQLLAHYEAIERANDAVLAHNPDCPRYCYSCQVWLDNQGAAIAHVNAHNQVEHSIH